MPIFKAITAQVVLPACAWLSALAAGPVQAAASNVGGTGWPFWGGDLNNTRSAPNETKLSPQTVPQLQVKWVYTAAGNVFDTPTVDDSGVYVTDWGGMIAKLDPATGREIWKHSLAEYTGNTKTGIFKSFSRNSPALSDTFAVFGDMATATVIAVDKNTGERV